VTDSADERRTPLVSILTPSRNQAAWLEDNLRSVASQTYPNIEHVVMDGASTDTSAEILKAAGPNVRWRSEPDSGQSDALNKAFQESRGDLIGWLNSDDAYFRRDAVALAVDAFHRNPGAGLVYGHAALVNAAGEVLQAMWSPPNARQMIRFHDFVVQPTVFLRRSLLGELLVDPSYDSTMDWALWLDLSRRTRFIRIDHVLAIDRHQPGRKVITQSEVADQERARLATEHRLPRGPWVPILRKLLTVLFRLVGVRLLSELRMTPLAFRGKVPRMRDLAWRQIAVPRKRMTFGG
jgi:glycosyltransferase involved in cell wall biosynthesis